MYLFTDILSLYPFGVMEGKFLLDCVYVWNLPEAGYLLGLSTGSAVLDRVI